MMNVIRIAKLLALVAFVLPWAAVSCSIPGQGSVDLLTASGIEFVQGKMTENKDAEKQLGGSISAQMGLPNNGGDTTSTGSTSKIPETGLSYLTIAGAGVILVGLLLTFAAKGAAASRNALITSLVAAALLFGGMFMWKDAMKKQEAAQDAGSASASSPFGGAQGNPFGGGGMGGGAGMIDSMLQERFGYWIAIGALIVAAGAGGLGMAGGANRQTPPPAA